MFAAMLAAMSVAGVTAENMCSFRVFRLLTQSGSADVRGGGPSLKHNDREAQMHDQLGITAASQTGARSLG
jgi:hypothetical protein